MNDKLELAQDRFLDGIGRMSSVFGMNKFVAQLYAILYLRGEPLSLDEIAEALGVSKGNVSINIRELEKWGAVRSVWVKGSRKDFYVAEPDAKKIFLSKVNSAIKKRFEEASRLIEEFEQILNSIDGNLSKEDSELASVYADRLDTMKKMKESIMPLAEMLGKFV